MVNRGALPSSIHHHNQLCANVAMSSNKIVKLFFYLSTIIPVKGVCLRACVYVCVCARVCVCVFVCIACGPKLRGDSANTAWPVSTSLHCCNKLSFRDLHVRLYIAAV